MSHFKFEAAQRSLSLAHAASHTPYLLVAANNTTRTPGGAAGAGSHVKCSAPGTIGMPLYHSSTIDLQP